MGAATFRCNRCGAVFVATDIIGEDPESDVGEPRLTRDAVDAMCFTAVVGTREVVVPVGFFPAPLRR